MSSQRNSKYCNNQLQWQNQNGLSVVDDIESSRFCFRELLKIQNIDNELSCSDSLTSHSSQHSY